jgi:hypothetical protein
MRVYLLRRVFPLSKKYTLFPFLGQITQKKLRYPGREQEIGSRE